MEYSKLLLIPTVYKTPVWHYSLWIKYEQQLAFLSESGYPSEPVYVGNIIIDHEEYQRISSLDDLLKSHSTKRYFLEGPDLYIHFSDHHPAWLFLSQKYGLRIGFTNGESLPFTIEGQTFLYKHGLKSVPAITKSADPFSYERMKFNSGSYTFVNDKGDFDVIGNIFGNEFSILIGKKGQDYSQYKKAIQYYISNIKISLSEAVFEVKDKRERLSSKAPNSYYDKLYSYKAGNDDIYPYRYIAKNNEGKLIQDAYGYCIGIPGVCIDAEDFYTDKEGYDTPDKKTRTFKFAREIKRIDKIEVKQKKGDEQNKNEFSDVWNEIPASLIKIDYAHGTITIPVSKAMYGGTLGDASDQTKANRNVNEVRATGIFTAGTGLTPILKDILSYYAGIEDTYTNYDTELTLELQYLSQSDRIGFFMDSQKDVYDWIELLQNGCLLGFQFYTKFDKYSARLDNPNRPEKIAIKYRDIVNLEAVEVDWNADLYASSIETNYAKKYAFDDKIENEYETIIDTSNRSKMLDLHRIDKVMTQELLMADKTRCELSGKLLLEDFNELRPIIRGIQLFGFTWFDLQIYDIVTIDFSVKAEELPLIPHHIVRLMEYIGEKEDQTVSLFEQENVELITLIPPDNKRLRHGRDFMGTLRCQIISLSIDPITGIVTIDVRQRDKSQLMGG